MSTPKKGAPGDEPAAATPETGQAQAQGQAPPQGPTPRDGYTSSAATFELPTAPLVPVGAGETPPRQRAALRGSGTPVCG